MMSSRRCTYALLCVVPLSLALARSAHAERIYANNCTTAAMKAAVKTKDGKKCTKKADEDIKKQSSSVHGIYCSSSKKYQCCKYKADGTIEDNSCETIKEVVVPFTPRAVANTPSVRPSTAEPGAKGVRHPGLLEDRPGIATGTQGPAATGTPAQTAPAGGRLY
jgi:hypothetical protein